jgi:hypothetical protein
MHSANKLQSTTLTRRETLGFFAAVGLLRAAEYQSRKAKVEILWKAPDGHPNALEATDEGLWVGDQISDAAHLLDWKTGRLIRSVQTECYNTSGIAYGGGFLWMAANGALKVRPRRSTDGDDAAILKVDPNTGKTLARCPFPGASLHELEWVESEKLLWATDRGHSRLLLMDPNFQVLRSIPVKLRRAHGLAWDNGSLWCLFSDDWVIQRLDVKDGHVLEEIQLKKGVDPEPHGLALHEGFLYYADAGMAGTRPSGGKYSGSICRVAVR